MTKFISVAVVVIMLLACGQQDYREESIQEDSSSRVLEFADSIGIELGDSAYVFGAIEDVVILSDGSIVVLDGNTVISEHFLPRGSC